MAEDRVPEHPASGKTICAVLVSYHPDPDLPVRVNRILAQTGALVIVDNGSGEAALRMLGDLSAHSRISIELNRENLGVARALNDGMQRARALGYEWVLLLDQDSVLDAGMVDAMIRAHASVPEPSRLAVLGAGFRDVHQPEAAPPGPPQARRTEARWTEGRRTEAPLGEPRSPPSDRPEPPWDEVESVITSGSLIRLATLDRIGAFREEFFIDYVDSEYCFRARARGFRVLKTRRPLMSHAIGASTRHDILGLEKWTSNHSPDRRYYMARNDTVMLKEYGRFRWGSWALKSLGRRVRTCKRIALYEDQKISKICAVAQGWWDGVRGRLGPRRRAEPR